MPAWKLTCAARHAVGRLAGAAGARGREAWWDDGDGRGGPRARAERFSRWWYVVRSPSAFARHRPCAAPGRKRESVPGYEAPGAALDAEDACDTGRALGPGATANASGLGDGGLAALPRGDPDAWAALLRGVGGGLGAALFGASPGASSYARDAGPEAWLRPPRLALPAAAAAWARAAPWARAALAFGDVPAAAWREDGGDYGPEAFVLGRPGPGSTLLLQLLAAAPAEGAGAIARVLESAVAARDAPGVRAACALAVAALRAPASSAVRGNGGPRAACPPALACLLADGDGDVDDDAALERAAAWTPRQAAAWCACATASSQAGGATARAVEAELSLAASLSPDDVRDLFSGDLDARAAVLDGRVDALTRVDLERELRCLDDARAAAPAGLAAARGAVARALAASRDGGPPPLAAALAFASATASAALLDAEDQWDGFRLAAAPAGAWATACECLALSSTALRACDDAALDALLGPAAESLDAYVRAVLQVRKKVDAARTRATARRRRGGSESDESSAESPDEDKADEEADRRERDLLGLAARTRAPDGERAFLDKACPRGAALFSPVPSYAAVVFACELLHGLRRRDAGEAVARARASATRVVGVVFRGLDDATCAWLRDLGGAAGDLKAGRCVGLKAAALASDPACADRCATPLVASLKQRQATATMRGALGLGPAGWRVRDASAGGVSLAPRDDAEDAAEDVFVEVASSKTTRCRRGRGVARQAHALRKALARLHGACACDGELAARLGEVLPCLAAARLRWPRPPPAHGRRPWSLGGNEAWCASGRHKRATFPTSKPHISAVFHSFRLIFGRAIISRNGLEAWMLFPERARAEHSR